MWGRMFKKKFGFTMVELMVVLIILIFPAAAAMSLYTANIKKAIRVEAEAALSAIRSAERIYKSEFSVYSCGLSYAQIRTVLGVNIKDACYFDSLCYDVATPINGEGEKFTVRCKSRSLNTSPRAAQAQKYFGKDDSIVLMMNEKGVTVP